MSLIQEQNDIESAPVIFIPLPEDRLVVDIPHGFRIDPVQEAEFSEDLLHFLSHLLIICIYISPDIHFPAICGKKCALGKHCDNKCIEGKLIPYHFFRGQIPYFLKLVPVAEASRRAHV